MTNWIEEMREQGKRQRRCCGLVLCNWKHLGDIIRKSKRKGETALGNITNAILMRKTTSLVLVGGYYKCHMNENDN